jgi:hypothetical protein
MANGSWGGVRPAQRHTGWTYILVPETEGVEEPEYVRSLRSYCRLALMEGLHPVCPSLWYRTIAGPGELTNLLRKECPKALQQCDRIWVHQPLSEKELILNYFSYRLLAANNKNTQGRRPRPVYGLKPRWQDGVQYHEPYRMKAEELRELMFLHLDVGLVRTL